MEEPVKSIKIEVGSKYILIIHKKLRVKERRDLVDGLTTFINDESMRIMVISGLDCTLEKVMES